MQNLLLLLIAAMLAAACSTTPAPGVCCIGFEQCNRLGLTEDRNCPAGQACVDLQCVVPSCSLHGCMAEVPVCDITTDVCTGCTDSADCSRFSGTGACDLQSGSCVECLTRADCTAADEPICEAGSCRGCQFDTECPSGACGDDGTCAPEENVVYLHPSGIDVGTCPREAPCRRIQFGVTKTSDRRKHIVLITGLYDLNGESEFISSQSTLAQQLFIHGGGSVVSSTAEANVIASEIAVFVRDLELRGGEGGLLVTSRRRSVLERVKISGSGRGVTNSGGDILIKDINIENTTLAIALEGVARLTLDRGTIRESHFGISALAASSAVVDISNLLMFGITDLALNFAGLADGTVSFTTIVDSGTDSGSGPRAVQCPQSGLIVRSSIIWAPGTVARPAIDGDCSLSSTIIGPTAVPGALNVDPRFVDAPNRNYHLSAGSPARDMVDMGPATDFEGDPRPRGARFDIGADESP